jgi:hypothetical protein
VIDRRQFFSRVGNDKRGIKTFAQIDNLTWADMKPHWRPVSDTYAGDYLVVPIAVGGDIKVDPDFAFLTGVFMAEGSFYKYRGEPNTVCLTIGQGEGDFRQAITDRLNRLNLPYTISFHKKNNSCLIHIRDRDFAASMLDLCGDYAHKKRMRGDLRDWSKKSLSWFLGGYVSGDGSIRAWGNHKRLRCRTASRDLATDLQHAFGYVGIPVSVNKDAEAIECTYFCKRYQTERTMRSKGSYCVSAMDWQAKDINPFVVGKSAMEDTGRERSWQKIHLMEGHLLVPIHSIRHKASRERVYNFEVEDDHSYVAYGVAVHNCNKDYTKAKGIILASAFRPIPRSRGNLWKVICLGAIDRSRDPVLANQILTGERNAYSMGAWTGHFTCSICGAKHGQEVGCDHVSLKSPRMSLHKDRDGRPQLAHLQARDILGFELSSVQTPAYLSAVSNEIMTWN